MENLLERALRKWQRSGTRGLAASALRKAAARIEPAGRIEDEQTAEAINRQRTSHHQRSAHRVLSRYTSFKDAEILEVGGNQACESAQPFLEDGASRVVVSGLDHISNEHVDTSNRLSVVRADALHLSSQFPPCSFDVVYGLSIVEHIFSPAVFLEEVFKVLKPGGIAYLEGDPIWSSPKGHHIWVATWCGKYKGTTSANYLFTEWLGEKSTNPLPDWSHLLMTPEEMTKYLSDAKIPETDIDCITDWVYNSSEVNRLTLTDIAEAYTHSQLTVLEANSSRMDVPDDILAALRKAYAAPLDYGISGVSYVLGKL